MIATLNMGLYILLLSPYKLPNFLTKFPTEPEVNLSVGGITCSIREGFKKVIIITLDHFLSEKVMVFDNFLAADMHK